MARPSAIALLLLSLLAVAHCRTLESDPHATADASTADTTTVAVADETGQPNPTVVVHADGFLRLPSHRHHPCHRGLFHRHLWWARHHGVFGDGHRFQSRRDGEPRRAEAEEEVKPVAEPDPDRSLPNSDGGQPRRAEAEEVVKPVAEPDPDRSLRKKSDGDDAAVKRWRMFRHGLRHYRHRHHEDEDKADHEREEEGTAAGVKRSRRHHHHHELEEEEDEEEEKKKPFHHDEDEDDELEEMVRRFRKVIMRRRFHHGRFFRHHHHQHAEEAQADGEQQHEGGGVVAWIKGLIMNRF